MFLPQNSACCWCGDRQKLRCRYLNAKYKPSRGRGLAAATVESRRAKKSEQDSALKQDYSSAFELD
jgi:hypothetical protein